MSSQDNPFGGNPYAATVRYGAAPAGQDLAAPQAGSNPATTPPAAAVKDTTTAGFA